MPRARNPVEPRLGHELGHQPRAVARDQPVLGAMEHDRGTAERAQCRGLVGTVHEGAALAQKDVRTKAQGHVVAEIEDVLPGLGEVEGLHLLAHDLREMPGLHARHAVTAGAGEGGLTTVALDGGGTAVSTDAASGPVAVSIHPWEVALEPVSAGAGGGGSARNRLDAQVVTVTEIGSRVRVGLQAGQPLTAEITAPAARELGLAPGVRVTATWKAAATRLVAR